MNGSSLCPFSLLESCCSRGTAVVSPRVYVSDRRQEEDLSASILQLNRSVGLLCRNELLNSLCLAPQDWPSLPTLAGKTAQAKLADLRLFMPCDERARKLFFVTN